MRRILLWAARNRWLKERLPRFRWVRRATRRFMPGETAEDALAAAAVHQAWGVDGVFTLLGENLTDLSEAQVVADAYHALIDAIAARGLDVEISLKLTQLGLDLDETAAVRALSTPWPATPPSGAAGPGSTWRAAPTPSSTIEFYERARARHANVGHLPPGLPPSDAGRRPAAAGHPTRPSASSRAPTTSRRVDRLSLAAGGRRRVPGALRRSSSRRSATIGRGSWRRPTTSRSSSG